MGQQDAVLVRARLIDLSREFGQAHWTILGEGNTSGRIDQKMFAVKSSGSSLGTLTEIELTLCFFDTLLPVLQHRKNFELRTGCWVRRIVHKDGKATGVQYVDAQGNEMF